MGLNAKKWIDREKKTGNQNFIKIKKKLRDHKLLPPPPFSLYERRKLLHRLNQQELKW